MVICLCGCGEPTKGTWAVGHDLRAVTRAYRQVKDLMRDPDTRQADIDAVYAHLPTAELREELTSWLTVGGSREATEDFATSGFHPPTAT